MGLCTSILDIEEIPAYLQKGAHVDHMWRYLYLFFSSPKGTLMTDTAKFDDPKPYSLQVSDDTWASLRLRVDPLAKAILEPHRLYIVAALLCVLLAAALTAIRPDFKMSQDLDDDGNISYNSGYYADDYDQAAAADDLWSGGDVDYNEWKYRNKVVAQEKLLWNLGFLLCFAAVIGATGIVSWMMESRNKRVDDFITEVCDELATRFEQEGYVIRYRTRTEEDGKILGHFFPERAICFRELTDDELRDRRQTNTYTPPSADPESPAQKKDKKKKKEAAFGSINVMVPDGFTSGQVVNVMTPSGLPIMVAVPNGILPGQTFPVQIPAQMYRPRK